MPPRVLLISARSDIGGGPAHVHELVKNADEQVNFFAALPDDGYLYSELQRALGQNHVIDIPRQRFALPALWKLCLICRENQIDLIHSHGKGAGAYSRLLGVLVGIPVVHTLHGYHDARYGYVSKKIYALWEVLAGIFTRKIICVSDSERANFTQKVCVSQGKLVTIQNGTSVFLAPVSETVPGKIVTVARFDYAKNLLEFVRVAQQLPNYTFHIIGDGEERNEIEASIATKNITNVVLHGSSQTVMSDIADAEVYLSTSRWEGLPMAVLEAMSLGIPVVASDVVGNRDAIAEGVTGYLYPIGDIAACVQAIKQAKLLDRSQIRKHHSQKFSSERMIGRTLDVYKACWKERSPDE